MKYSALRNPHSTSCYGILSDLFWVDILAVSSCKSGPARRNSAGARWVARRGAPARRTQNYQYLAFNHSRV